LVKCNVDFPMAATNRCGFWETLASLQSTDKGRWNKVEAGSIELDVLIWLDATGKETEKWTAKQQVTFPVSHRSFEHFRDIKTNHVWSVNGEKRTFAFQRLPSPTTSEAGFIFAIPTGNGTSFALNVRPQSLVDPVVPPGYGFAVLDPTGRVLFHSEDG